MDTESKPLLVGGLGEINFGKQYRQGNRVYSSNHIAMAILAEPVGNMDGYSYLYLVEIEDKNRRNASSSKHKNRWHMYLSYLFYGNGGRICANDSGDKR